MIEIERLLTKARHSTIWRSLLNFALPRIVPFNGPHKFKVLSLSSDEIRISVPFARRNLNHLKGLHACALATAAELSAGLALLNTVGSSRYRLVMQSLNVEYSRQGRSNAQARCRIDSTYLQQEIIPALQQNGECLVTLTPKVFDMNETLLCEAKIIWQLKQWEKVRSPHPR